MSLPSCLLWCGSGASFIESRKLLGDLRAQSDGGRLRNKEPSASQPSHDCPLVMLVLMLGEPAVHMMWAGKEPYAGETPAMTILSKVMAWLAGLVGWLAGLVAGWLAGAGFEPPSVAGADGGLCRLAQLCNRAPPVITQRAFVAALLPVPSVGTGCVCWVAGPSGWAAACAGGLSACLSRTGLGLHASRPAEQVRAAKQLSADDSAVKGTCCSRGFAHPECLLLAEWRCCKSRSLMLLLLVACRPTAAQLVSRLETMLRR
jgi:hypothetical protein